jgi:hypothetical protein
LEKVFAVLDGYHFLGEDGCLRDEVQLVGIGDYFDWGPFASRRDSARESLHLLSWLAAHPPEQVILLAGNHDLARVGELVHFQDVDFHQATEQAAQAYRGGDPDLVLEAAFLQRFPQFSSAEVAARDLSGFLVEQRDLVERLLTEGRLQVAVAWGPHLLLTHAGISRDHLAGLGLFEEDWRDAVRVAEMLNAALFQALEARAPGAPLELAGLHRPGDASRGEGGGIFFHRPGKPDPSWEDSQKVDGSSRYLPLLRTVFDARRLPLGLTQVLGHVRDHRCRKLLGDWARPEPDRDGVLRHLRTDGVEVCYGHGIPSQRAPEEAHLIFLDVGWNYLEPEEIEILDLDTLQPRKRGGTSD